jgi:hypothetical protein
VRAKRLLGLKNINVYALGLYVDAPAAKRALHKHKGAAGASQPLYDGEQAAATAPPPRDVVRPGRG